MLVYAIIFINLALLFYSIGVWNERWRGILKGWHVLIFWLALFCDTMGTTLMSKLVKESFKFDLHSITGLLAIILMLFHVLWASIVLLRNNKEMRLEFHRLSVAVWFIWLIPFVSGVFIAIIK